MTDLPNSKISDEAVAVADSQPPEGLLRKIAEKLIAADQYDLGYPLPNGACNCQECCERVARAVLAALFEACEVREERRIVIDDENVAGLWLSMPLADSFTSLAAEYASGRVERRLVIETQPEPVSSTGEERTDGA